MTDINGSERCPSEVFIISSDGRNALPLASTPCWVVVDKNVQQRLRVPDWTAVVPVREWLDTSSNFSLAMQTVAIEEELARKSRADFHNILSHQNHLSKPVFNGPSTTFLRGPADLSAAILITSAIMYANCAEVAWTRAKIVNAPSSSDCLKNCNQFLEWRQAAFPNYEFGIGALMCLTALAGGRFARDALKLFKRDASWVRNAACDASHLGLYAEACKLIKPGSDVNLVVFVTADEALAKALPSFQRIFVENIIATSIDTEPLSISQKRWNSLIATTVNVGRPAYTPEQLVELAGHQIGRLFHRNVPLNITDLRNAFRRFLRHNRESGYSSAK